MHDLNSQQTARYFLVLVGGALMAFLAWSCENPSGVLKLNSPPFTSLANIPVNDTMAVYISLGTRPLQTLYWSGGDPDGYIIGFRYRWTDSTRGGAGSTTPWKTIVNISYLGATSLQNTILVQGSPRSLLNVYNFFSKIDPTDGGLINQLSDSLHTGRPFAVPYKTGLVPGDSVYGGDPDINESPTKGSFIFGSDDSANVHKFEVAAVDNDEVTDPTPATVFFWTQQAPAPIAFFARAPKDTLFVLREANERFQGLSFVFTTIDPSTFIQEFSWCVDDTINNQGNPHWGPWDASGLAYVTASSFLDTTSDELVTHRMFLRARNRWGVISATVETTFVSILPAIDDPNFPTRYLIINDDRNGNGTRGNPDTTQVNDFYRGVMQDLGKGSQTDLWTMTGQPIVGPSYRFPARTMLSKYRAVLFLLEQPPSGLTDVRRAFSLQQQKIVIDYLGVGGKLIFSSCANVEGAIANYFTGDSSWARFVFHVSSAEKDSAREFVGSKGLLGYPSIPIDPLLLPADSLGAIRFISSNLPLTFGQTISLFDASSNSSRFEDRPLGVRYLAPTESGGGRETFSMVFFGFPLYYCERSAVVEGLRKAFIDIHQ